MPRPRDPAKVISMTYTNHRGETSRRNINPGYVAFEESKWHEGKQWILRAYDLDKGAEREFALKDCNFDMERTDASNYL